MRRTAYSTYNLSEPDLYAEGAMEISDRLEVVMKCSSIVLRSIVTFYYGHILALCSLSEIKGCGLRYRTDSHIPTISHGYKSRPSDFPWHVAIYRKVNSTNPNKYICGGTIIHQKLILTAAHCVYDENKFSISTATFTVITGKYNRSWGYRDSIEQRFKVIDIKIPEGYQGFIQRYSDDIAVLSLNETIKFSSVTLPICISWDSDIDVKKLSDVTVVGWGLTENGTLSNELLTTQLKYFNFTTCSDRFKHKGFSQFVTDDKFCAGLENGTSVEQGDSGGGLIVPKISSNDEQRFYIVGIVSTKDIGTSIATFTNINKFRHWLNETVTAFIEEGFCPTLSSKSVELTQCNFKGASVDCKKPAIPGTKAKLQCKSTFHAEFPYLPYTDVECQKNLTWSPLMDSCLECGNRYKFNDYQPLISYKERKVSEFPWQIAIYAEYEDRIRFICGGTLIHPKVVLIAAVCAYSHHNTKISSPKKLFVVAGKYHGNWNIKANFEQRFQVSSISVHSKYRHNGEFDYEANIALLLLNDTVKLSSYIMPVCIDWSNKLKLLDKPYVSGLAAGWGITEDNKLSDVLRSSEMLMINHTRCSLRKLQSALLPDKFCIISEDGSSLSIGDIGGVVFPKFEEDTGKQSYYLYGTLGNTVSPDTDAVTDILYYEDWIKNNIMHILNYGKSAK